MYSVRGLWAFISSPDFSLVRVSNVHVLASTLKLYLREQRQLVLHRALFPQIRSLMESASVEEQRSGLKYVISLMDPVRRLVLKEICWACSKILLFAASNKMDRDNVSICLSPSIIDADSDDPMEIASTAPLSRAAFSLLLSDSEFFDPVQIARDLEQVESMEGSQQPAADQRAVFQWNRLTEHEWSILFGSATMSSIKPGAYLCREGEAGASVLRIQSGSCLCSRGGRGGDELGALDMAGVELSLGVDHYLMSAVASAPTRVYQLPVLSLMNAFAIDASLAFKWYCSAAVGLALQRIQLSSNDLASPPNSGSPVRSPSWIAPSDSNSSGDESSALGLNSSSSLSTAQLSSTATFALKLCSAKMIENDKKRSGTLALTATHLSFESSSKGSAKKGVRAAVFVSLGGVTRVSATDDGKLTATHDGDRTAVFELESAHAKEMRDAVARVLALRHEAKILSTSVDMRNGVGKKVNMFFFFF